MLIFVLFGISVWAFQKASKLIDAKNRENEANQRNSRNDDGVTKD
jgi:hypothetical protein